VRAVLRAEELVTDSPIDAEIQGLRAEVSDLKSRLAERSAVAEALSNASRRAELEGKARLRFVLENFAQAGLADPRDAETVLSSVRQSARISLQAVLP
jgi:hypothetical protein